MNCNRKFAKHAGNISRVFDMANEGSKALFLAPLVNCFGVFIPVKDNKVGLSTDDFGASRCFCSTHYGNVAHLVFWVNTPRCSTNDGRCIKPKVKERQREAGDE